MDADGKAGSTHNNRGRKSIFNNTGNHPVLS